MNLNDCLIQALHKAHALVDQGYWVRIETFERNVTLDYGVIHSNGQLECTLQSLIYIADPKPNASKESQCLTTPSSTQLSEKG